jgi:hypothetical protein
MVVWDYKISGHPTRIIRSLNCKIGAFRRRGAYDLKVGITANPERRWAEKHKGDKWDKMYVLYQSSSLKHTQALERIIERRFNQRLPERSWNMCAGGGGRHPAVGPYFVYLLTY